MSSKCGKKCCAICSCKVNLKACSACGQIYYCSVEHQKAHWKAHKGNCKAYEISSDAKVGRFLQATRDINAGSVILTENPIVIGPDWNYDLINIARTLNCVGCFEPIRMLNHRCPVCKWPCCQPNCIGLQNSKLHDVECAFLKGGLGLGVKHENDYDAMRDYYRTDILFPIKCLLLQHRQPRKFQQLMELEGHVEDRKATGNFMESEKQIDYLEENFLKPFRRAEENAGKVMLPEKDRKVLQKIYGIIETNAIYLTERNEIAGLYALGCIMEHSCVPNCHYLFDKTNGFKLTVRAARNIKKNERIVMCYTNVLWGTQLRRQQLLETKYFKCTCDRCADGTELGTHLSTLKCIGSDDNGTCDGLQIPVNPLGDVEWKCNKCPAGISGDEVASLMAKMGDEIDRTLTKDATVPALEALMEKLSVFLHANHYHMFTLKHTLIQLYGNHRDYAIETITREELERKLHFCDDLLQIVERLDPHNVRLAIYTAVILYEKFNAIVEMQRRQMTSVPQYTITDALKCLKCAQIYLTNESDSLQGRLLSGKVESAMKKWNFNDN